MFDISKVKEEGMKVFKVNYWSMVLVALIFGAATGLFSSFASFPNGMINGIIRGNRRSYMSAKAFTIEATVILLAVIIGLIVFAIGFCLKVFLINPLIQGTVATTLKSYEEPTNLKNLGKGFKENYGNVIKVLFFRDLYIFLWSLLFIVPGIVKAYEYRMMSYLLVENPDMTKEEAFAKSKEMMTGRKGHTFAFDMSFIGWFILNILTCGILGVFYVNPYYMSAAADVYREIKKESKVQI